MVTTKKCLTLYILVFLFLWSVDLSHYLFLSYCPAIDLVDEAAAKLKMEITSKPTELDEIDRAVLKLEMEKLSLKNDTDKASKERLSKLEHDLEELKQKQKELTELWDREKDLMNRIRSLKEEVSLCLLLVDWPQSYPHTLIFRCTF